uniref:Uncharacterized protein n=1 Tax=Tremella fuciformis TaxID=64657 RepID=A0A2H4QC02_9TREE|nr:hypothetical protein [Tremella fuciformis]ATX61913.1 hypothetical protein [Tremella fuciformis]ATX62118.1 hypothetical protein [Tremella fuciformis]
MYSQSAGKCEIRNYHTPQRSHVGYHSEWTLSHCGRRYDLSLLWKNRGTSDVDSSYPLGAQAKKGSAVRRLKRYVSWVQYDVSQYGFYLPHGKIINTRWIFSTKGLRSVFLWCTNCWITIWHRWVATNIKDKRWKHLSDWSLLVEII